MQQAAILPIFLLSLSSAVSAGIVGTWEVGTGTNTSTVQLDFSNGNGYVFQVHWTDAMTTGWDLMLAIADSTSEVDLNFQESEWGVFLMGIDAFSDSDWGTGAGWPEVEDYWHYWTRDSSSENWEVSQNGASAHPVQNGSWDGWVFLSAEAPQPVPAPGGLLLLAGAMTRRRRHRRAS